MAVSMMDIAKHCGFSRPTVSLVLSGKGELLRPETVERVLKSAATLGYRANTAARAMRLGRHSTIALLSSSGPGLSPFPLATLNALHDGLSARSFRLLFSRLDDSFFTTPELLPSAITEHCADAIILNRLIGVADPVTLALEANHIPTVWFNIDRDHDTVRPDDYGTGRMATTQLIDLGHRRISYVSGWYTRHISEPDRRRGYMMAMRAARLAADARYAPGPSPSGAGPVMNKDAYFRTWLAQKDRPTALVLNGTAVVQPVRVACAALGLRIPEDLSLMLICGEDFNEFGTTTASLRVAETEIGTSLAELVLARLERPADHLPTRLIPSRFFAGDSLAPPP